MDDIGGDILVEHLSDVARNNLRGFELFGVDISRETSEAFKNYCHARNMRPEDLLGAFIRYLVD